MLKLLTASGFAAAAIAARSTEPSREVVDLIAATTFRHFMGGMPIANGDTLIIPDCMLRTHLDDCMACRRSLWLSRPGAMLLHARSSRRQLVSSERGWSFTSLGATNQTVRPHPVVLTMATEHGG